MRKGGKVAALVCAVLMVFAGCGGKQEQTQTEAADGGNVSDQSIKLLFPQVVQRDEQAIRGGTFVFGLISDTPWKGVFNTFLYEDNPSYKAMLPMLGIFLKAELTMKS